MKRVLFLCLIVAGLASCNQAELERLRLENAELQSATAQGDSAITAYIEAMDIIGANLVSIKMREQSVVNTMTESGSRKSRTEQIQDDVELIAQWMQENKQIISKLESKLNKSTYKVAELRKLVANLERQLAEKDRDLEELGIQLDQANIQIKDLFAKVEGLSADNMELSAMTETQAAELKAKAATLNTAYYIVGSKSQLKEMGIIDRKGQVMGFGKRAKQDLNTDAFTKIDIRDTQSIRLDKKKIKISSAHKDGTYELEGADPISQLKITDPAEFWGVTRYLVIIAE